jgi:DNA-binding LytR/AlgR family response regulator
LLHPLCPWAGTPVVAGPRLLGRLPGHLAGPVLAIEMEDHYARVHTAAGSVLLLMRMRDAVAEMDGADGAQVHRSWWVARDAVEAAEADGRNVRLRLAGGLCAPVARGQVAVLREAGWPVRMLQR